MYLTHKQSINEHLSAVLTKLVIYLFLKNWSNFKTNLCRNPGNCKGFMHIHTGFSTFPIRL